MVYYELKHRIKKLLSENSIHFFNNHYYLQHPPLEALAPPAPALTFTVSGPDVAEPLVSLKRILYYYM